MSKEGLHLSESSAFGHVPAHSAHRVRRGLFALLILASFGLASPTLAETAGDAGQITRETDLREKPSPRATSIGRLPKGTIVTQKGERKDRYYHVEVELEDGVVEGWVAEDALSEASRGNETDKKEAPEEESEEPRERVRPSNRLRVPKDEGLLLRREQSFFYGLHITPEISFMTTDIAPDVYTGFGYSVGAHLGIFTGPSLAFHAETNYTMVQGIGNSNGQQLQFGFFDVNAQIRYFIERFEIGGGVQYSVGLSFNDIPPELGLGTPQDMSSLYGLATVGYRFPMNEVLTVALRLRYAMSFVRAPVAIQRIGFDIFLEFGG